MSKMDTEEMTLLIFKILRCLIKNSESSRKVPLRNSISISHHFYYYFTTPPINYDQKTFL